MTEEELKLALILLGFVELTNIYTMSGYIWSYRIDKYHIEKVESVTFIDFWDNENEVYLLQTTDIDAIYNKIIELLEEENHD